MRSNFFGEQIAQPTDDVEDVKHHLEELGFMAGTAHLESERDDTFLYGGELRNDFGEGFHFDGFESVDAARAFAEQFVPANCVEVIS